MKPYKRIFTIVIDSLGVGAMPNAAEYDDEGCDTLGHIDASMPKFHIPNLAKLGLANLHPLKHVARYHGGGCHEGCGYPEGKRYGCNGC